MDGALGIYSAAQALRTGGAEEVRAALTAARARTLLLMNAYADGLASSGFAIPYRATLNPPLWEWGHVAWFQEWWIARNRQRGKGVDADPDHERTPSLVPNADELYDSSRIAHPRRWHLPLPDVRATRDYLDATQARTLDLLASAGERELYFFKLVALHEEMHAEAACYMAQALGIEVPRGALREAGALDGDGVLEFDARTFAAGWQGAGFAFDNELRAHEVALAAFDIDAAPVSWDRFLEFAKADGYRERRWWDDEGWAWLAANGPPDRESTAQPGRAATHLTAFEADAWCRWSGRRLPTEFEWECAALTHPGFTWGQAWEWTSSPFAPYPGFEAHPYRDYSAPWFGSRRVLRGAAPATAATLMHPRYRNFFEPQRDDVFAGFRTSGLIPR